ncbi:MAG: hypothetical protein ACRELG_14810 [Gemmataceae bacterium]
MQTASRACITFLGADSRADFTFCLLAIDWGWTIQETAARLLQESGKAQENGEAYALRTARNAAAAIERRGGRQR